MPSPKGEEQEDKVNTVTDLKYRHATWKEVWGAKTAGSGPVLFAAESPAIGTNRCFCAKYQHLVEMYQGLRKESNQWAHPCRA